jgi:hypothetical protein
VTARERRAFAACAGGRALDAMDVQMYSFVIPNGQAGMLGTTALLVCTLEKPTWAML